MSDAKEGPEGERFLTRWSRLKREAAEADTLEVTAESQCDKQAGDEQPAMRALQGDGAVVDEDNFDAAKLPSLDSIGIDTDIRGFLRPNVPPDLTRAALRRAWSSDPAIRDYIGPVENGWDFNDPAAMAGFGPLEAVKDMAKLVAQAIGQPELLHASAEDAAEPAQTLPPPQQESPPLQSVDLRVTGENVEAASAREENAADHAGEADVSAKTLPPVRRGGGALPV